MLTPTCWASTAASGRTGAKLPPSTRELLEYAEERAMTRSRVRGRPAAAPELTAAWVDWLAEHRIDAVIEPTVPDRRAPARARLRPVLHRRGGGLHRLHALLELDRLPGGRAAGRPGIAQRPAGRRVADRRPGRRSGGCSGWAASSRRSSADSRRTGAPPGLACESSALPVARRLARLRARRRLPDFQSIAIRPRASAPVLVLALVALLVAGCGVQTKPATSVTATSATLNAVVHCDSGAQGTAWWELRKAGGSWNVVGAQQNLTCPSRSDIHISKHVTGLQAGAAYDYRVALDPPPDDGKALRSTMTRFSTPSGGKPVVAAASGFTPATLRTGSASGPRLELKGVNVWGLQDSITTSFGAQQYEQRATVAATIKSWGANLVRFRVLADDYNNAPSAATGGLTKAQIIQRIKDWKNEVVARGMYFMVCSWDALDGAHSDAQWAGNGQRVHQLFADIHAALGDDPMVIYEVTNEPNNVGWADWDANMRGSIRYFRDTIGYRGLLVIDPIWWANSGTGGEGYDDGRYSGLEAYDAAQPGMKFAPARVCQARLREQLPRQGLGRERVGGRAGRVTGQAPDFRDGVRQLQRRLVDGQQRLVHRRGGLLREPLRRPAELRRRGGLPVRRLVGRERAHRGEQHEHDDLGIVGSHVPGALTRRQRSSCAQAVSANHCSYRSGVQPRSPTSSCHTSGWLSVHRMSVARVTSRPRRSAFSGAATPRSRAGCRRSRSGCGSTAPRCRGRRGPRLRITSHQRGGALLDRA